MLDVISFSAKACERDGKPMVVRRAQGGARLEGWDARALRAVVRLLAHAMCVVLSPRMPKIINSTPKYKYPIPDT